MAGAHDLLDETNPNNTVFHGDAADLCSTPTTPHAMMANLSGFAPILRLFNTVPLRYMGFTHTQLMGPMNAYAPALSTFCTEA